MYFFKFLQWLWNDYLYDGESKIIFCAGCWAAMAVLFVAFAVIFNSPSAVLYLMTITISALATYGFGLGISFMYKRYRQWQSMVFNKLRE